MQVIVWDTHKIAVIGNYEVWMAELRRMGGRENKKQHAMIFPARKEDAVVDFVTRKNANVMRITEYADGNLVVRGDYDPWTWDLERLGGEFKINIDGKPGYIFPAYILPALTEFIEGANSGRIHPNMPTLAVTVPPKPEEELQEVPQEEPEEVLQTFQAADGLVYQIVMITVPMPEQDQALNLVVQDTITPYHVSEIESDQSIVIAQDADNALSRAVVIRGKWQIPHFLEPHELVFL